MPDDHHPLCRYRGDLLRDPATGTCGDCNLIARVEANMNKEFTAQAKALSQMLLDSGNITPVAARMMTRMRVPSDA